MEYERDDCGMIMESNHQINIDPEHANPVLVENHPNSKKLAGSIYYHLVISHSHGKSPCF